MQPIELAKSGLRAPQLGFGCAAILGRVGRADSLRALAAAWDQGIRFFDTARSYGYGESEAVVGEFLRGRRDQAVVATKFGILAAAQPTWKRLARKLARQAMAIAPGTHGLLRKAAAGQFSHNQFTVPVLRQSIEESLRKLGTDYVDLLFLHSPPAGVLAQQELLEAMGRLVEAGKVRVAGLSAEPAVVRMALSARTPPINAMQFPCNVFDFAAAEGIFDGADCILVANHPFGGVARVQQCRTLLRRMAEGTELQPATREKLRSIDDGVLADVVLNAILRETGIHVVVPAMMRPEHIHINVRAVSASRFDAAEIAQIRRALVSTAAEDRRLMRAG